MPLLLFLSLIAAASAGSNRRGRRWTNVKDTAAYLGVTPRGLRLMVADGRLTQYTLGKAVVRFDLDEVDAAMTPTQVVSGV